MVETSPALAHGREMAPAHFSPDGRLVVTGRAPEGFDSGEAVLWSVADRKAVGLPMRHNDGVVATAFGPDGRIVATGGEDGVAQLWSVPDCAPLGPALQHLGPVRRLLFNDDGTILATGTSRGLVRLWDVATGEPLTGERRISGGIASMAFVRGASEFSVLGNDGVAHRWSFLPAPQSIEELERLAERLSGK